MTTIRDHVCLGYFGNPCTVVLTGRSLRCDPCKVAQQRAYMADWMARRRAASSGTPPQVSPGDAAVDGTRPVVAQQPASAVGPIPATTATRAPSASPAPIRLDDVCWCSVRRAETSVRDCMDRFVDAMALNRRDSCCWRCPHGDRLRQRFAEGVES